MQLKLHVQRYHMGGSESGQKKNKLKSVTFVKKQESQKFFEGAEEMKDTSEIQR